MGSREAREVSGRLAVDGELYYDPFDYSIDADPHPVWKRMRDEAPLYRNDRYDFWALSRFEDVWQAARDVDRLTSGHATVLDHMVEEPGYYGPLLLFTDPPEHTRLRKMVSGMFTPAKIGELEDRVTAAACDLLDPHVGSSGFDFVDEFGAVLPAIVMCSLLGIAPGKEDALRRLFDASFHLDEEGPADPPVPPGSDRGEGSFLDDNPMHAVFVEMTDLHAVVEERRVEPRDDILSVLLHVDVDAEDGEGLRKLTMDEVLTWVIHLAGAGLETVARLLSFAGVYLARHPDQRALLVDDPGLVPGAVEELLRYEAPSPVNARWVEEDVELHGTTLPPGSKLLLLNGSAGRDEREFEDPDTFDVRRKVTRHLAFGYGTHYCLGAALARLEARVALRETLRRFPSWSIDESELRRVHTSHVRGFSHVPIHLDA